MNSKLFLSVLLFVITGCAGTDDSSISDPYYNTKKINKTENAIKEPSKENKPVEVCHVQEGNKNNTVNNLVFGIPLGTQFTLPECKKDSTGLWYELAQDNFCFKPSVMFSKFSSIPVCNEEVAIHLQPSSWSSISPGDITGLLVSGQLERIIIYTTGYKSQNIVLQKLIQKYGKPMSYSNKQKQNGYGATFGSHFAVWKLPNLSVVFGGTADTLDTGILIIETDVGEHIIDKEIRKTMEDKNPM